MSYKTDIDRGPVGMVDEPSDGMIDVSSQYSDTVDLTDGGGTPKQIYARYLFCVAIGTIIVIFRNGTTFTFVTTVANTLIPFAAVGGPVPMFIKRIKFTGTTMSNAAGSVWAVM